MSPYITGLFLVFSGMLIGFKLWYRDRSDDEALRESLKRDNEDLRASLKLARNSHEQLDERFTRQKGRLNVLQQLCDDWSQSREQAERDRVQLEVELADKTRRLEESSLELQLEREKRVSLEDETHLLTQSHITNLSSLEDEWRQRNAKIESSLVQRQDDLKSTTSDNDRLAKQLHQAEARVAELQSDLAAQQTQLETATKNASGLEQEYVSVETSLEEAHELLKAARSECASALSAQKVAEESLVELRNTHAAAHEQIDELQSRVATMESLESNVVSLREACDNSQEQLGKVSRQRDETMESEKQAIARSIGLQKRIDNQEATIHGLRAKHDDAMENLKVELNKRTEIEASFECRTTELQTQLKEQTVTLQRQTGDLSLKFEKEQSEMQNRIAMQTETIQQLTAKRENLDSKLAEANQHLDDSNNELESAKRQTGELTSKVEELKTTCLRISELEKLLHQRDHEDELVIEELRTLRDQYADSYSKQQELQSKLDRMALQQTEVEADSARTEQQLEMMQTKLTASEETIRTLRRERAAVLARLANYRTIAEPDATVISFTEAMQRRQQEATHYDSEYGGPTSQHAVRGLVYTKAPESKDDLKRISGIAEVLEARLNDYGIYTFKQIKDWQPEAIEEFSRLLAFRDRIERDEWLRQAGHFYAEKQRSVAA